MLHELRAENLLLMERAELRLGPGLNVVTGETGAGKTLLAHALDLLLGGRARRGIVRDGAGEAWVEGVFDLPGELAGDERIPDGATELVLARRVWPDGRTRAYVCGRAATQGDLAQLGGRLLAFYGQHEHRRLMLSTAQLELLDAYCGDAQTRLRARMRDAHDRVRGLEDRAAGLRELAGSRDRELDLVRFELAEIDDAAPSAQERAALVVERDRLRHQGELADAASHGVQALAPEGGEGVAELVSTAAARLADAAALDAALAPLAERCRALHYEAADLGAELRDYLLALAGDGGEQAGARLQEIQERLALLARLERKHGGSLDDVLAHAERCRRREAELTGAEGDLESVDAELTEAIAARDELAARLTRTRAKAAPRLAKEVRARLAELAMEQARFEIALHARDDGCGARGADVVEMQIAANGGSDEALAPLREVASGGELSRVMLALLSVAHGGARGGARGGAGPDGMLVFDEIDAGIGGHTARAVGEHLRALAAGRQVLCITHLPQVAALAERHFTIVKDVSATPPRTTVSALEGDGVVEELVRMMGAGDEDTAAGEHARELLRAAA